jgi:MFS family permease
MNALFAIGAFYCAMHIDVPERTPTAPATRQPIVTRLRSGWENTRRETAFLAFIGGRATLNIGLSLIAAIVPIYWVNHLDASDTWVGYFNAALSGATLLSYFPWVRIKRKYGTRRTLLPAVLGTTLYPALLTLARAPAAVLPVIAFNGFAGAGLNLAFFDALLENCPPDKEAQFVAINMAAVNLTGIIGPPVGAALLGVMDIRWVLVCGTFISLAGFAVFALVRPKRAIPASRS